MPLYEYACTVCKHIQEKTHKIAEVNTEPCDKCGAEAEKLKKNLSPIRPHGSWSRWTV